MAPTARLPALTSLRFFLAFWVVISHQIFDWGFGGFGRGYLLGGPPLVPHGIWVLIRTGFVAVSVFFVLSGFVLSYNYSLSGRWDFGQIARYAAARFARVYPVYVLALFLMAPFMLYLSIKNHAMEDLKQALENLALDLTLMQSWNPNRATSWNFPAWTLSVEAFLYCCFPWIGTLLWRLSIRRGIVAVLLLWGLEMAAPVALTSAHLPNVPGFAGHLLWSSIIQYNPALHLPDFCIGIILGRIYNQLVAKKSLLLGRGYYLYGVGLVLAVSAIECGKYLPYIWQLNGLFTPLFSLVVLGLALGGGSLVTILSARPMVFLGNASYGMYILHVPVFLWMNYLAYRVYGLKLGGYSQCIVYLEIVCLVSALVFRYLEQPANRFLRNRLAWRSTEITGATDATMPVDTAVPVS